MLPMKAPYDLSASCQRIVSQDWPSHGNATLLIRSCLSSPQLWPVMRDHKCNGVTLVPSGLYGDMASTVATYLWTSMHPQHKLPGLNISQMHVEKPYIVQDPPSADGQWITMSAATTALTLDSGSISCTFSRAQPDGAEIQQLASCIVVLENEAGWRTKWTSQEPLLHDQIRNLQIRADIEASGAIRTIRRDLAYELFKTFVEYDGRYRVMNCVTINSKTLEATAELEIQANCEGGLNGPYWLDGSCHISGFVCNAIEEDSKKNAYISHGWDGAKISSKFRPGEGAIRNFVRMQAEGKDALAGTVFVMQGSEIVGVWEGVRFNRIPRRVLNVFLPPPKK